MSKLLVWLGLAPNQEEKEILRKLRLRGTSSMRVVGRGTLTMSAREARETPKAKKFISEMEDFIS